MDYVPFTDEEIEKLAEMAKSKHTSDIELMLALLEGRDLGKEPAIQRIFNILQTVPLSIDSYRVFRMRVIDKMWEDLYGHVYLDDAL